VIFRLNTGKINGALYYGNLVFPFPNGAMPPVDDVLKTIEEVVTPIKAVNPGLTNMLRETFVLTRLTSDQSDIAKAGSVLVLYKDGLVLYPLSVGIWPGQCLQRWQDHSGTGKRRAEDRYMGS
jgi:hypothetical protein